MFRVKSRGFEAGRGMTRGAVRAAVSRCGRETGKLRVLVSSFMGIFTVGPGFVLFARRRSGLGLGAARDPSQPVELGLAVLLNPGPCNFELQAHFERNRPKSRLTLEPGGTTDLTPFPLVIAIRRPRVPLGGYRPKSKGFCVLTALGLARCALESRGFL